MDELLLKSHDGQGHSNHASTHGQVWIRPAFYKEIMFLIHVPRCKSLCHWHCVKKLMQCRSLRIRHELHHSHACSFHYTFPSWFWKRNSIFLSSLSILSSSWCVICFYIIKYRMVWSTLPADLYILSTVLFTHIGTQKYAQVSSLWVFVQIVWIQNHWHSWYFASALEFWTISTIASNLHHLFHSGDCKYEVLIKSSLGQMN